MDENKEDQPAQGSQEPRVRADEDWKKSVAEERQRLREQEEQRQGQSRPDARERAGPTSFPEPSIQIFLAGLYTQTLVALGALEDPATGKPEKNVAEAAYLIDTIDMLRTKTEGNLTDDESAYVQNLLYDLKMRYVSATEGAGEAQKEDRKTDEKTG
jgi:hypothetical protein